MQFSRNALGELRAQTDARNVTTGFSYDLLGRMRARTALVDVDGGAADSVIDTWLYDPVNGVGELASSERKVNTATERSESHNYDAAGRLTSTV